MIRNAYNNHIDTIYSGEGTPTKCDLTITVLGVDYLFTVYPSPDGSFYFNYKPIMKKLVNRSNFKDEFLYPQSIALDQEAFIDAHIAKLVTLVDTTTVATSSDEVYLKGVHTLTEKFKYIAGYDQSRGEAFFLHKTNENNEVFLRYWLGMPFDFALYGSEITLDFWRIISGAEFLAAWLATPQGAEDEELFFDEAAGVYRFAFSNGVWQTSLFDQVEQFATITYNDTNVLKLNILNPICGGVYLKWHNQFGGWDYWMFDRRTVTNFESSQIGTLKNDFANVENTESPVVSAGKNSSRVVQLFANGVFDYEIERLMYVSESPKVYMYLDEIDLTTGAPAWLEVLVEAKTKNFNTAQKRATLSFELTVPTYNLTL